MKSLWCLAGLLVGFHLGPATAFAQLGTLQPNERIRVTAGKYFIHPMIGDFEKLSADSFYFKIQTRSMIIANEALQKVEVSRKQKRHTTAGAIAGALSGGLILGLAFDSEEKNAEGFGKVGQPGFVGGFAAGAVLGGGIGALIGRSIRSEEWQEIWQRPN